MPLLVAAVAPLCHAQLWPFAPEYAAKVETIQGDVSQLRDGQPWALNSGDTVQPGKVILSGADGYALLKVADGSTFEVFPNSKVIFRTNPGNWKDLLDVVIGRVKIHIQRLGGQPNHNRITSPTAVISVRGTVFDVVVEDNGDTTMVVVDDGEVAVQHALMPYGEPKVVKAGEFLRVYKNQPLARSNVGRDSVVQHGLRALAEALYTIVLRTPRAGGGSGIPGGGAPPVGVGDTGAGTPPPAPPPPPAAPPVQ